jgi:hypothetical protein
MASFGEHFSHNMKDMGLDAPQDLFSSAKKAKEIIGAIVKVLAANKMRNMTMGQLASAIGELALPIAESATLKLALKRVFCTYQAVTAAYYVGACIGSLGVASWKMAYPDKPIPAVQHLTDADINRILQEHRIEVTQEQKRHMLSELRRHNTPNTAFGVTAAGSR